MGPRSRAGGRARGVRADRIEDTLQDLSGRASRGLDDPAVLHVGTGNYNPKTARLYEDIGLLTAAPDIGADLTDLFNSLTGYSRKESYRNLLVAPYGVRRGIIERIEREIAATRDGAEGRIRMKANALVDEQVIDSLYRASQAGVRVEVVVRGICALRPGAPPTSRRTSRSARSSADSSSIRGSFTSAPSTSSGSAAPT